MYPVGWSFVVDDWNVKGDDKTGTARVRGEDHQPDAGSQSIRPTSE